MRLRQCRYCGLQFDAKSARATVCYAEDCQRRKNADRMRTFQAQYRTQHGRTYNAIHFGAQRASDAARRRAVLRGAQTAESFLKEDVYARDGWICGLCLKPVDRDEQWPSPLSVSLDHVLPLSLGGDHSLDNTQCAHLGCNSAKGARVS